MLALAKRFEKSETGATSFEYGLVATELLSDDHIGRRSWRAVEDSLRELWSSPSRWRVTLAAQGSPDFSFTGVRSPAGGCLSSPGGHVRFDQQRIVNDVMAITRLPRCKKIGRRARHAAPTAIGCHNAA